MRFSCPSKLSRGGGHALAASLLLAIAAGTLPGQTFEKEAERLRSADAFERQRGEAAILRLGPAALSGLVKLLETDDRLLRFRVEGLFSDALDAFLDELEQERQALLLDENELAGLKLRKEAASLRPALEREIQARMKDDSGIQDALNDAVECLALEAREKRATAGESGLLDDSARMRLETLRKARDERRRSDPKFDDLVDRYARVARIAGLGTEATRMGELETIRMKDLDERIAGRRPKVQKLEARLDEVGWPAWNGLLVRGITARQASERYYVERVTQALAGSREPLVPEVAAFDAARYTRSLLWAFEVDRAGPHAGAAQASLERHIAAVLKDRGDPEPIVKERAADELYFLGARGRAALAAKAGGTGKDVAGESFLAGLLRWRIRPRTYARVGIDFSDYERLDFRDRRKKLFDYARAAEEGAIPTLRAVITEDDLEPSFNVKLAAAKALAGLEDMSGFNYLVLKHPDLTLKKPEVSRELLIIQALESIRDKNYQKAVEDLQRILDEFPFDFRANYQIAFAYLLLKNYAKAIHHFEIARRINSKDELTLYNLACAYALSGGKSAEAMEALEASVKAGFDDYEHMEKDPDLDSLRSEDRYRRLIDELKAAKK